MLGAVREIRPRWIVGENVPGIVDWSEGLVFEQVCSDMENEGYEVQPFVLPACGVNAPHKRNRIWFVAHRADSGSEDMCQREDGLHAVGVYADTDSKRLSIAGQTRKRRSGFKDDRIIRNWERFPTESPVCRRDDGFPGGLDGITFPSWCRESVKAYGNAIYMDIRDAEFIACDGRRVRIHPDLIADFRDMPFDDCCFKLVVFDPPHFNRLGVNSYTAQKYGRLFPSWETDLKQGFDECMRVLEPFGILIFKWNESQIPVSRLLEIFGQEPLFGHRSGKASKTHWMCFMKK